MPYKIVQTIEKGRPVLTSIPETWENDGILLWPRKFPEKLVISDENYPHQNWLKSKCLLKRTKIVSYEEAEKEIERMCSHSDTESYADTENEDLLPAKQKRKHQKHQPTTFHNENFNNLAEECLVNHKEKTLHVHKSAKETVSQKPMVTPAKASTSTGEPNLSEISYPVVIAPETSKTLKATMPSFTILDSDRYLPQINDSDIDFVLAADTEVNKTRQVVIDDATFLDNNRSQRPSVLPSIFASLNGVLDKVNHMATQLPTLFENQTQMLNNQELLSNNQQILVLKIVELNTQFEEMIKQCSPSMKERNEIDFNIITCAEEAEMLEIKLKDAAFKADLEKKFSVVCRKERGKGLNNAYIFIDLIFSREFLKQCSWGGGSRKEASKICFRAYKRIFDFFFGLLKMTDTLFTKEDCTIFLKNVLRNSVSRSKCKQMRMSSSRNRPKCIKRKLESKANPEEAQVPTKLNKSNVSEQNPQEATQETKSSDEDELC